MLGDLLVLRQGAQLREIQVDGVADQATDLQPVVGKVVVVQRLVFDSLGVLTVVPQVGGDVLLCVLPWFGVDVLEQALQGADQRLTDALDGTRVSQGERSGCDPPEDDDDHRGGEDPEPDPRLVIAAGVHMTEVFSHPRRDDKGHMQQDEEKKPDHDEEVRRAGGLDAEH